MDQTYWYVVRTWFSSKEAVVCRILCTQIACHSQSQSICSNADVLSERCDVEGDCMCASGAAKLLLQNSMTDLSLCPASSAGHQTCIG